MSSTMPDTALDWIGEIANVALLCFGIAISWFAVEKIVQRLHE